MDGLYRPWMGARLEADLAVAVVVDALLPPPDEPHAAAPRPSRNRPATAAPAGAAIRLRRSAIASPVLLIPDETAMRASCWRVDRAGRVTSTLGPDIEGRRPSTKE